MPFSLTDSFHRTIDYLRISVTDRCNFRCRYCMPPEGLPLLPHKDILSFEEIARVARVFMQMGGRRIRITGGEPLLRRDLPRLIAELSCLTPHPDLGLTTNGSRLAELARPLKEAGLERINVSLDSTNPERFRELTATEELAAVWSGIETALAAGLITKINVVAMRGLTPEEILSFVRMATDLPVEVRFIEFMPLCGTGWHPEWMLPMREIRSVIEGVVRLKPRPRGSDVAETFDIAGAKGRIGFIASMTEPFCGNCSRLRLTSDGKLRPCLFSDDEIDLRGILRNPGSDDDLRAAIANAVWKKPFGHALPHLPTSAVNFPRIRFVGG